MPNHLLINPVRLIQAKLSPHAFDALLYSNTLLLQVFVGTDIFPNNNYKDSHVEPWLRMFLVAEIIIHPKYFVSY